MKLVSFKSKPTDGAVHTGIVDGTKVYDISEWLLSLPISAQAMTQNMLAGMVAPTGGIMRWLQSGTNAIETLSQHFDELKRQAATSIHKFSDIELYAPVPRPGKIIGVGRNYADHAAETGVSPFEKPRIIFKVPSAIAAHNVPTPKPASVTKMDFESELAVVIGGYAKNVSKADALSFVAGYTVLNDVSAREFQFDVSPAQTTFAKSMDGFSPMGPWLVTRDEIVDPQNLEVYCWLNGVQMQHGHTKDMLFSVATLISYLSEYMTLEPGDVITTGTPAGIGAFRKPPVYLQPGDVLKLEVTGVGVIEHRIV
jgi:2-keto-4-pentenoate hydratase/2-oxohepta-3-ene-1,7-dioic acid hydratase in catechol pathway